MDQLTPGGGQSLARPPYPRPRHTHAEIFFCGRGFSGRLGGRGVGFAHLWRGVLRFCLRKKSNINVLRGAIPTLRIIRPWPGFPGGIFEPERIGR